MTIIHHSSFLIIRADEFLLRLFKEITLKLYLCFVVSCLKQQAVKTTNTLDSLILLTDETDEDLYGYIADAIVSHGNDALPSLKKKLSMCKEAFQRERVESLIYLIEHNDVVNKLREWHGNRQYDLLEPYFILARYRFPYADWDMIGFQLVMIIEQAERELTDDLTPLEKVKVLNHIIYGVNGFKGDKLSISNPDYYFLNTLLETRVGNPLSLGLLYTIVAQRLGLPIYGICLPYHFILAYTEKTEKMPRLEDVLFYINPYNDGLPLTRKEIRNYLYELKIQPELKYFEPTKNSLIVRKLFNTVIETYSMSGKINEANELREIMNY